MEKHVLVLLILLTSLQTFAIDRFAQIDVGVWRGAQPMNQADYDLLKSKGIRTIVDLRDDNFDAEKPIAEANGFISINFPMNGKHFPSRTRVAKLEALIADPRYQPVFIHCKQGKDRTGVIAALYRTTYQNWSAPAANQEMRKFGFSAYQVLLAAFFSMNAETLPKISLPVSVGDLARKN